MDAGNFASGYGDYLPALLVRDAGLAVFDGKFRIRRRVEEWLAERWSGMHSAGNLVVAELWKTLEGNTGNIGH
ncbi:hypothetical protein KP014_10550 [Paenibacillus sophorae]|uniref:Uncharacterized protein n=1 Tax=Paenibacillus sophorae TaxID=1333845 RepID=A0ABX8HIU5_9BACL|nr:hypothetical protein [Paenibacillus sophorae]QWU17534.1 hypothetical protein KP014_10550 [Paenibacillus sophorae]